MRRDYAPKRIYYRKQGDLWTRNSESGIEHISQRFMTMINTQDLKLQAPRAHFFNTPKRLF